MVVDEIHTAGKVSSIRSTHPAEDLQADGRDVMLIDVDLTDSLSNVVPTADNLVTFTLKGNGKLLGVDNGNPRDDTSFKQNSRKAFNGHVFAIIQADRTPGEIQLIIQCEGLKDDWQHKIIDHIQTHKPVKTTMEFEDLK